MSSSSAAKSILWRPPVPRLERDAFNWYRAALLDLAGITLSDSKMDLVEARLVPRLHELALSSYDEYRDLLRKLPRDHPEWQIFLNAMTTNKTSWFREPEHFKHLADVASTSSKVWCAASSTGEEPYTIAATLQRTLGDGSRHSILASDLDTEVLETALKGVYRQEGLHDVPQEFQSGNFSVGTGEIEGWMKVSRRLRDRVSFQQQNLIDHPFPWQNTFDVIFCRNVFIYFSKETVEEVVTAMAATARKGAYLYIGHSESLHGLKIPWQSAGPSIYRLP